MASHRVGGAMVTVTIQGRATVSVDLTPTRRARVENVASRRVTAVDGNLNRLEELLSTNAAGTAGLDTLGVTDAAARAGAGAPVAVLSSGVSTYAPLDLREWGWPDDTNTMVRYLVDHRGLPRHLASRDVFFFYLGDVAGQQPPLPGPAAVALTDLYIRSCQAAGAHSCTAYEDLPSGMNSKATLTVPRVEVPVWTLPPPNCETTLNLPTSLLFAPNSAKLTGDSRAVLEPLAQRVIHTNGRTVITLVRGHSSDAGPGDGKELSLQRARHVADELISLGVNTRWIGRIDGVGESDQVAPDWNADGSPSRSAQLNRRVEIRTITADC